MKKLYALAVAAFAALSASAAAGDWLTVENFENNPATPGLFNLYGQDGSGTVTIETVATTDNADNHAAKFTGGDYNTGVLVTVTLPEGKTIADYKAIGSDGSLAATATKKHGNILCMSSAPQPPVRKYR